ncbi:MAG: hypothetical protein ACXVB0_11910 [Mucilaginibacter sp.]
MDSDFVIKIILSILMIGMGLMAKYSHNDGWSSAKKYWVYLVVIGAISLMLDIWKYCLR